MSVFDKLDQVCLVGILREWLSLKDICFLDNASCSSTDRSIFLYLIANQPIVVKEFFYHRFHKWECDSWLRARNIKITQPDLCEKCEDFFPVTGSTFCSQCSMTPAQLTVFNQKFPPPIDVDLWCSNSVHTISEQEHTCRTCNTEKHLVAKWNCACPPTSCRECAKNVAQCTQCGAGGFGLITKEELSRLLKNNFSQTSRRHVAFCWIQRNNYTAPRLSFAQLICKSALISEVVAEACAVRDMTDDWEAINAIFSFAVDPWNIADLPGHCNNHALCYKGMRFENRETAKIFANIMKARSGGDFTHRILATAYDVGY